METLPKWMRALVTLLGVYPASVVLVQTIGRWTSELHCLLRAPVFAASMVVCVDAAPVDAIDGPASSAQSCDEVERPVHDNRPPRYHHDPHDYKRTIQA